MDISKLCRKNIDKFCIYCKFNVSEIDENNVICKKRGSVLKNYSCRKFSYNPLKRIPPKRVKLKTNYNTEDFKI